MIDDMLKQGVIGTAEGYTEWCSPASFVPKPDGGLRLVTDFRHLNSQIDCPIHPFPTTVDIQSRFFGKLDLCSTYHQLPLAEESQPLTTFLLPSGHYFYKRAPMGCTKSGDWTCKKTDIDIEGKEGTYVQEC